MGSLHLSSLLDIIAAADPAGSKKGAEQLKRTSARMACVCIGQDALSRVFVLHAWAQRTTTENFIEHILQTNRTYRPQRFGIEANAMQVLFGDAVQLVAKMQGEHIPFEPIYQPTNVQKAWRIRTALNPLTANGRLFIQSTHLELRAELEGHPNFPTVDIVDALATAIAMLPDRRAALYQDDEDLQHLAQYLRETGASPDHIKQRLAEERDAKRQRQQSTLALQSS